MPRPLPPRTRPVAPRPEVGDIVRHGGRRYRVLEASPVVPLSSSWWCMVWEVDELGAQLPADVAWQAQLTSYDQHPAVVEPPDEPDEPCPACGGSGEDHYRACGPHVPACPACRGTGVRR